MKKKMYTRRECEARSEDECEGKDEWVWGWRGVPEWRIRVVKIRVTMSVRFKDETDGDLGWGWKHQVWEWSIRVVIKMRQSMRVKDRGSKN